MAHFAKLDANNIVTQVIVVDNRDVQDVNGVEMESFGIAHCQKHEGYDSVWKKTSYNAAKGQGYRGNFAGIGYTYDQEKNAFIPPRPYDSWTLNETTCEWEAPVTEPDDEQRYFWNETTKQWDLDE